MYKKFIIAFAILILTLSGGMYPSNALFASDPATASDSQEKEGSILDLLKIAIQPVGSTMYVWGGGWNEEDTAAGIEARSIGLSGQWESFFKKQNKAYDFNKTKYRIHDGLDCSGYMGWVIYNFFHRTDGEEGYVMKAEKMAKDFAQRGWGKYTPAKNVKDHRAGDIMSNKGHVYLVIGACKDGSIVLLHASPPGVQINGTVNSKGNRNSEAAKLADRYMKGYYPDWYAKFKPKVLDKSYLRSYDQMRWSLGEGSYIKDEEQLAKMTADKVLQKIFEKAR
ncbi:MAG: hypothetical protein Q4A75_02940 [Peptostreptococcaceae bacterium]|nr:hypothetical protein [Peptostreptococcaceae bacterium]